MATPDFTAGAVMNASAALLNDVARAVYTYAVQLPYINMAARELQQIYQQNEMPVTTATSVEIAVAAGQTAIVFGGVLPVPAMPTDLVEIQALWEKNDGSSQQFSPMTRLNQLPESIDGIVTGMFIYWAWNGQEVKLPEANVANVVKMDYIKALFTTILDENQNIGIINAQSFLEYRTAGLCAKYIGENPTRSQELNGDAGLAMDRLLALGSKSRQAINVRRRPFRSSYKTRGY